MDSINDLILKGHFNELKEKVNQLSGNTEKNVEFKSLLSSLHNYLTKLNQQEKLDPEGQELLKELTDVIDRMAQAQINIPQKLPMKKASAKIANQPKRNTGS